MTQGFCLEIAVTSDLGINRPNYTARFKFCQFEMKPIHFSPFEGDLIALGGLVFWVLAYALMVRRGFRDKSFGMPVTALCVNLAWEVIFLFSSGTPLKFRIGIGSYLALDLVVLYTCLRFGRADYPSPLMQRYFNTWIAFIFGLALVAVSAFKQAFADTYGGISATFTTLLLSTQLVALLVRRNGVSGQSFYIGLCVLVGDAFGWVMNYVAQDGPQPNIPIPWVNAANFCILTCNVLYLVLYFQICRRDGLNPLRRL